MGTSFLNDWIKNHSWSLTPVKGEDTLRFEQEISQLSVDAAMVVRILGLSASAIQEHTLSRMFLAQSLSRWDPYPTPSQHKKVMAIAEGLIQKEWLRQTGQGHRLFSLSKTQHAPMINRNSDKRGMVNSLEKNITIGGDFRGSDPLFILENPFLVKPFLLFLLYSDQPLEIEKILSNPKSHIRDKTVRSVLLQEVFLLFDPDWFQQKSLPLRILLVDLLFHELFSYGGPVFPFQDILQRILAESEKTPLSPVWKEKVQNLVRKLRMFCTAEFTRFLPETNENQDQGVTGLCLSGLRALKSGAFQQSDTFFQQALKLHKKCLGKRKITLPPPFQDFFFLEKILNPDSDYKKILQELEGDNNLTAITRDLESRDSVRLRLWEILNGIDHSGDNRTVDDMVLSLPTEEDLLTLFSGLLAYADRAAAGDSSGSKAMGPMVDLLGKNGWGIWATLFSELQVLYRISEGLLPPETPLEFLGVFRPVPQWKRTVSLLKKTFSLPEENPENHSTEPNQRILWLLVPSREAVNILPLEQKRMKSGRWGTPKPLSRKRLENPLTGFPDASSQELLPLGIYQSKFLYTYIQNKEQTLPLLDALVDHPHVYWNDPAGMPIKIRRAHPEIHAEKKGPVVEIRIHPASINGKRPAFLEWDPPRQITLLQMTGKEEILSRMIPDNLSIPEKASGEIRDLFRTLEGSITIFSEWTGDGLGREELPPDNRMRFLILPESEGYRVSLRIRPLGDETPAFTPGIGLPTIYGKIEEHPVLTRRDLSSERIRQNNLISALPSLGEDAPDDLEWLLDSPLALLTLLDEIHLLADPPVVEWPEGRQIRLSQSRKTSFDIIPVPRPEGFWLSGEMETEDHIPYSLSQIVTAYKMRSGRFLPLGEGEFLALSKSLLEQIGDIASHSHFEKGEVHIDTLSTGLLSLTSGSTLVKQKADWKKTVDRFHKSQSLDEPIPKTLEATLRPYQEEGFRWLSRLANWGAGACLADDMGLGKTIQILTLILSRAEKGPCLVVAPSSVVGNWASEAARFAPTLKIISLYEGNRREILENALPHQLILTSYTLLANEIDLLADVPFEVAVLDEAQSIKNADTQRAQAAYRLKANVRIAASGTPVENHLQELWSLFRFLNPGYLGAKETFREQFILPIEQNKDAATRLRLRKKIQPFLLRRMKHHVLEDLPPKTEINLSIELDPEERALYETIRQEAIDQVESSPDPKGRSMILLSSLMKLRRAACNPFLVLPEKGFRPGAKINAFLELVSELRENNHRALVFSAFVDHLTLLKTALEEKSVPFLSLDGSTPQKERGRLIDRFQAGEGDLFLISLKAGGTGLNLTGADYVIHMDPWWNPAVEDQATDRAHRIGQSKPVTVYRLVSGKTIEEKILELHKVKRELADSLLEGADASVSMSLEMMMELLKS